MKESDLERLVKAELAAVGWTPVYGPDIAPGEPDAERADYRDVVLAGRLRSAVARLNPALRDDAVDDVVKTVLRPESQSVLAENWRGYQLLIQGVPVEYQDTDGTVRAVRARLVDWDDPANNDLLAINQFTVIGVDDRRPDVLLFVNGLPLVLFELKRPGKEYATLRGAFNQTRTYQQKIPDAFTFNQLVVISDGVIARAGTLTAAWEHFAPWKTIDGYDVAPGALPQIEVLISGMLRPEVLLDLVRSFTVFADDDGKLVKKAAKYHQYWAVTKAVQSTIAAVAGDGRAGVVWHTQGSGKSLEMEWYAGKVMRDPAMDNPTLVVLTDRNDLDDQLFDDTFAASRPGAPLPEFPVQAESRAHLKELLSLRESGGIIFSTIQKFGLSQAEKDAGTAFPTLSARRNIVVMVDEAHRSNYDFIDGFARHLRDGLPNAAFIGFTGTPIEAGDRSTSGVFGDYIDVYDLTQAVTDGATVKVLYEPRLAKIEVPAEALGEIDDAFAAATSGTEEEAREQLKTKWARIEALVGSEKRITELATDILSHWDKRREVLAGKAMVVTMSRRIAAALYAEIARQRPEWVTDDDATGKVKVVITGAATDDELLQPHIRSKKALRALKSRAKDPDDELELVIVRDMWLTGFDSPSMHTMYVDKPMRGAPLMQAIARVNRTFKDKPSGLVVDYLGIAEDLKDALADYTQRDQENQELGQDIRAKALPALLETHGIVCDILHGFDWRKQLTAGGDKAFLHALSATVDYLLAQHPGTDANPCTKDTPCAKCRFLAQTRRLVQLYAMCVPADEALAIREDVAFFEAVRSQISKLEGSDREGSDPSAVLDTALKQIVSDAMTGTGVIDIYAEAGLEKPDLSLIDEKFVEKVRRSNRPNLQIELLKRLLSDEIRRVGRRNVVTGRQFSEMLEQTVLRYQNRTLDAAQVVAELVALAQHLKGEADRGKLLGLTSDELAFYDAVCTNASAVLELGDDTLKKIAHDLVEIVRRDAKTDWSVKEQVRAKLRATIKRLLLRYGYPPDQEPAATQLVLEQAEVLAGEQAA
ncbi:type I restriction endonuclease subunit R [Lapillicoccus jejuensis]|uniref:Type I restriction enzyme endonuclease subunit n=1 Tax=Lapillicoccus jejuensis TaxID=402171 RepID=A0A542DVZ6_9MICO|nr:type I restriction endonuclease subunit R [Lapillicoccus jejuensis]TQJ07215.1 type I restriction enzyme R subunit [Lapillicoccus jejuensis]